MRAMTRPRTSTTFLAKLTSARSATIAPTTTTPGQTDVSVPLTVLPPGDTVAPIHPRSRFRAVPRTVTQGMKADATTPAAPVRISKRPRRPVTKRKLP